MRKVGYAFNAERDLDDSLLAGRLVRGINTSGGRIPASLEGNTIFAEVDAGQSGYSVTATQKIWDSSLNSGDGDWAAPTGTAWRWNTTAFNNNEDYTFKNLRSTTELFAGDIVEVILYPDKSETTQYLARPGGGGSSLSYIEITASTNISTYTGTIYNNPIDRTSVETGVTVRALQHSAGTIPNSAAGQGFWCIKDSTNNVYHITNYSVFYSS